MLNKTYKLWTIFGSYVYINANFVSYEKNSDDCCGMYLCILRGRYSNHIISFARTSDGSSVADCWRYRKMIDAEIVDLKVHDVRFPTTLWHVGSDSMVRTVIYINFLNSLIK